MNLCDIKSKLNYQEKFEKLSRRLRKNGLVAFYYELFSADVEMDCLPQEVYDSEFYKANFWKRRAGRDNTIIEKAKRISSCCSFFSGDYYRLQGVKDLQKVNLCMDRFCDNCQNTLSVQRFEKYEPLLLKLAEEYDIDHVVLTVPNVPLYRFSETLDKMLKAYKRLNIFLLGKKAVRNVNFAKYGYLGSIRALEITKNRDTGKLHPHFHCLWLRKKAAKQRARNLNAFSFNRTEHRQCGDDKPYYFTDFEILIQKVWRCLCENIEVNYSNIENMVYGYDCMIKSAKGHYKEIFKYATKGLLSSDPEKSVTDNYEDWLLVMVALYHRRLMQGYGALYQLKFDNVVDMSPDDEYMRVKKELHKLEIPVPFYESLQEVGKNIKSLNVTYISRKSLGQLGAEDVK